MTRAQKEQEVAFLKDKLEGAKFFYVADSSQLTVEQVNTLRGKCFEKGVEMRVAKNTLLKKALEERKDELADIFSVLTGPTAIFLAEAANSPAKVMKEFRKDHEKPVLKAAFIDSDIYVGDEQLETLAALKSKQELIGEVIALLQSPVKNVLSALQSGGTQLAGIVKTLSERSEPPAQTETEASSEVPKQMDEPEQKENPDEEKNVDQQEEQNQEEDTDQTENSEQS